VQTGAVRVHLRMLQRVSKDSDNKFASANSKCNVSSITILGPQVYTYFKLSSLSSTLQICVPHSPHAVVHC
jgi:hypothetical protein